MLGISILMKSLSAEVKGFLHVDGINWERTFSTISAMSSFAAFAGDFTHFKEKPKAAADSDDNREDCCPNNLAWFHVIGHMFLAVTSKSFSTLMYKLVHQFLRKHM